MTKIDAVVTEFNEKLKVMQAELTETMKGAFKEIFEEAPNLHMITWVQYAPYFNDGDPCEFSVHELYAVHKDYANEDENEEFEEFPSPYSFEDDNAQYRMEKPSDWYFKNYPNDPQVTSWNNKTPEDIKEVEKVEKFLISLAAIPEDIFKAAFGEDNAVYVFKDRIETEDYSGNHD